MKKFIFYSVLLVISSIAILSCQKQVDYSPQIANLTSSINALQKSRDSLAAALATTNSNNLTINKSLDSIRTQLTTINGQITLLNNQMSTANTNIASLISQIATLNQQYQDLLTKLNALILQMNLNYPSNGLIAWYAFSGNANDNSGNSFNGTVVGATLTTDRFGQANSAYSFVNTGQYIDLSNSNFNIQGNAERTVACWIYPTNTSYGYMNFFASGSGVTGILSSNNGKTFNLRLNTVASPLSYNLGFMGYSASYDFDPLNGTAIYINKWTHVAVTYGNNTITLYVNGVKGGTTSMILNTTGNSNYIGRSNHTDSYNYFNGKIDEVRIYNKALSANEILNLATN